MAETVAEHSMIPKEIAPYLVALLVAALLVRRVIKSQKPRAVNLRRLWILPVILVTTTGTTLANEPVPSPLAMVAFVLAGTAGAALGWFRVHTLEFSVDPETRAISSKATPLGAILLIGLLVFRYALKYALHLEGVRGVDLVRWTDGAMMFTLGMLVAQSAHTWIRAHRLLPPRAPTPISGSPG